MQGTTSNLANYQNANQQLTAQQGSTATSIGQVLQGINPIQLQAIIQMLGGGTSNTQGQQVAPSPNMGGGNNIGGMLSQAAAGGAFGGGGANTQRPQSVNIGARPNMTNQQSSRQQNMGGMFR